MENTLEIGVRDFLGEEVSGDACPNVSKIVKHSNERDLMLLCKIDTGFPDFRIGHYLNEIGRKFFQKGQNKKFLFTLNKKLIK